MELGMYVIKDELTEFAPPIVAANDDAAKRYFSTLCKTDNNMKTNAQDYSIWKVGTFDTEHGIVDGLIYPELLTRGLKNEDK